MVFSESGGVERGIPSLLLGTRQKPGWLAVVTRRVATMAAVSTYPRHWEADVLLRDGSTMRIRPIRPSDAQALQDFHVAQSDESTYYRFFAPLRRLSDRDLTRLVNVDHQDRVALVVVGSQGEIVAVGRYDRVEVGRAEVAFNVSDALQGRGLGSVLLEHLAAAARERGISEFVADVLPGNSRMIRVFTDAGYDVVQRYDDGVISLSFAIDPTQRSLDVIAGREQRTDAASMRALLSPRSIMVVAGTSEADLAIRVAANVAHLPGVVLAGDQLEAVGLSHTIPWATSIAEAGELLAGQARLDLALVSGAPDEVVTMLEPLAAAGARGVVVLSGGFDEGDNPTQSALVSVAREAGLRLVGPRSFGLLTHVTRLGTADGLNATLWPRLPQDGATVIFTQSGAAALGAFSLIDGLGLATKTFLSAGHRADVSGNDLLQYISDDDGVAAVGLYLESLGNPRKFARVARRVSASRPVVAVVGAGESRAGTTGLSRVAAEAAMHSAGIVVAPTMRAMVETVQLLATQPLPPGNRVAIWSNSSALAELAAVQVEHLDPHASVRSVAASASASEHAALARELADDPEWDVALVLYSPLLGERDAEVVQAIATLGSAGRPVLAVVHGLRGVSEELTTPSGQTVPSFESVEDAVAALTLSQNYAQWRRTDHGELVDPDNIDVRRARELVSSALADAQDEEEVTLRPRQVTDLLAAYGIATLPARTVRTTPQALAVARDIGFPVAVKATDPALRHRADLGGVRLNVAGPIELVEATRQIRSQQESPALIVQAMGALGVACVVKAWEDPIYGPVISFGLSGDASEFLDDVTYAVPPLRTGDVSRLVRGIRSAPRLLGERGGPQANVAALEDLVARVAQLVELTPQLRRLELLPVLVSAEAAITLHAQITLAATARPDGARRALRAEGREWENTTRG